MKHKKRYIVYGEPFIGEEEILAVKKVLKSRWLGPGPNVTKFENAFRKYIGSKHAIAVNSCTSGLWVALKALGIKKNDEIITTPLTFVSTINSIINTGARPVFVDVKNETGNINPDKIQDRINERTKAILPVHFAGRPCEMKAILKIAKKNKIFVIEDAAHAIESKCSAGKVGNIGDITVFSFYGNKNITTGEGGMVTTNNSMWSKCIRNLSTYGLDKNSWERYRSGCDLYRLVCSGYNFSITDIQASIGIEQLKRLRNNLVIRNKLWKEYNKGLRNIPGIKMPIEDNSVVHSRHMYTIEVNKRKYGMTRNVLSKKLKEAGIGTGIHYKAYHLNDYYKKYYGNEEGYYPNAERISKETLSLPLSPTLTKKDISYIVENIKSCCMMNK